MIRKSTPSGGNILIHPAHLSGMRLDWGEEALLRNPRPIGLPDVVIEQSQNSKVFVSLL
jgi:hypothetical protein